jgi:hypothetical protein
MFLTSSDGTRIAYDVQGHGPALLLLPGLADAARSGRSWDMWIASVSTFR